MTSYTKRLLARRFLALAGMTVYLWCRKTRMYLWNVLQPCKVGNPSLPSVARVKKIQLPHLFSAIHRKPWKSRKNRWLWGGSKPCRFQSNHYTTEGITNLNCSPACVNHHVGGYCWQPPRDNYVDEKHTISFKHTFSNGTCFNGCHLEWLFSRKSGRGKLFFNLLIYSDKFNLISFSDLLVI